MSYTFNIPTPFVEVLIVAGFLMAIIIAYIVRWIASNFVSEREAKIASFAFTLAGGGVSFNGSDEAHTVYFIVWIFGVVVVWWLFFKREKQHG